MLSPEQLDTAGDAVAAVYNDIEAKMLDHLVSSLLDIEDLDQRTITELNLLAQSHTGQLRSFIESERGAINEEVRTTAERLLKASDEDDVKRVGEGSTMWPQQVTATVEGVGRILARDNIQMVEGAKQAFLNASVEAITRVNTGTMTTERALHSAVRKLEREGIPIITYQNSKTGMVTVANKVDVAVRRHIRTQIAQDGARMTMDRIQDCGVTLVEVSSHEDSRESHAVWQGRVYSIKGEVEIDGQRYQDFYEATGYGSVDGLLGANCRHSFGPYRVGAPRAYEPEPKHPSGLGGAEIYELEQTQRYLERRIREDKRELRGAQQVYDKVGDLESRSALVKAQNKLKDSQSAMRDLIKEANAKAKPGTTVLTRKPNREWAGDMPKTTTIKTSGRKLDDFLRGEGVRTQMKSKGVSIANVRASIRSQLYEKGGTTADFSVLSASDQQSLFRRALNALSGQAKAERGKHVDRLAGVSRGKAMTFGKANGGSVNPGYNTLNASYWRNCQSSVVAFEARLRGFDVQVMPFSKHSVMQEVAKNPEIAWTDPATGEPRIPQSMTGCDTPTRAMKYLEANIKEGERYTLRYDTRSSGGTTGHIVSVDRTENGIRIYDPQSGEVFEGRDYRNFIRVNVQYKSTLYGMPIEHPMDLLRVDDLDFNLKIVNQIVTERQ